MLTWICPECGSECEPSDRDCPSCYPPGVQQAAAPKFAAAPAPGSSIAMPPPLPPAVAAVAVQEPVALPAFLLPVDDSSDWGVKTLKLPVPVVAAAPPPPPPPPPPPVSRPAVPAPAGLTALSHTMQIWDSRQPAAGPAPLAEATPLDAPLVSPLTEFPPIDFAFAEPGLRENAGPVPMPARPATVAAPDPGMRPVESSPESPVSIAVATPEIAFEITPDPLPVSAAPAAAPEPEVPLAGPESWAPARPGFYAPAEQTGVALSIQQSYATWSGAAAALAVPFHDAAPGFVDPSLGRASLVAQPWSPWSPMAPPPAASVPMRLPAAGYALWPFETQRPAWNPAPLDAVIEADPSVFVAVEKAARQAVEAQFDARASQMAPLVRLHFRLSFRKCFTASGYWLDREPFAGPPARPEGIPVPEFHLPMDRAVLQAVEQERRRALEEITVPSPQAAAAPATPRDTVALVVVPNPSGVKIDPNKTVEFLHPIIETPVPAMARLQPLPILGLRPKLAQPWKRQIQAMAEFGVGEPYIPQRGPWSARIIPSPIYGEKRPKSFFSSSPKAPANPAMAGAAAARSGNRPVAAGWMVTAAIALLIPIGALGVVNYWILPAQRASAASSPSTGAAEGGGINNAGSPAKAPVETAPAATQEAAATAATWRKSIQLTGLRLVDGGRIQFLVVNVGKADLPPSSTFQVTLRSATAKPGDPPVGSFQVRLNAPLSPREARDLVSPINLSSQLRGDVDINDLRVELQPLSSPVAIRR